MRPLLPSSLVAVAVALLATRDASADDTLRLTWKAPAGCPSIDDVRAATLREVDARAANSGVLEADAYVEQREATSWAVRLRTRRGMATGEREIEAETCDGVAQATAVVLALALVPPSEPEPEPERVPGAAAAPPTPPPADLVPRRSRVRMRLTLSRSELRSRPSRRRCRRPRSAARSPSRGRRIAPGSSSMSGAGPRSRRPSRPRRPVRASR